MEFWLIYLTMTLIPSNYSSIIEHKNGFPMINTRWFEPVGDKPYILPSQCEKVFYSEVPHKLGWSFFFIHDPRGRLIKYITMEEEDIKEEEEVDHDQELVNDAPDANDVATNNDDDSYTNHDDDDHDHNHDHYSGYDDDDPDGEMDEE